MYFSSVLCCLPKLEAIESGPRAQIWDGTKLVGLLPARCLLQVSDQVQNYSFCVDCFLCRFDCHLAFCRMGEYMDPRCKMRDFDQQTWQSQGKPAPLKVKFSVLWRSKAFLFLFHPVRPDNISRKSFSDPYITNSVWEWMTKWLPS